MMPSRPPKKVDKGQPSPPAMAMREVKPVSDRQWAMVVKQLREGPTPEMGQFMAFAKERAKHIREIDPGEVERRRKKAGSQ